MASATTLYDFKPKDKKGAPYDLTKLRNKVVLIVNTASECSFTPQFEGLEKLYKKITKDAQYKDQFVILGFPCNQFMNQDPVRPHFIFCILYVLMWVSIALADRNPAAFGPTPPSSGYG
ncbi:MAG: hypothetical protein Q9163_003174 [Psora crenata]